MCENSVRTLVSCIGDLHLVPRNSACARRHLYLFCNNINEVKFKLQPDEIGWTCSCMAKVYLYNL
jgi:hypothetical protein